MVEHITEPFDRKKQYVNKRQAVIRAAGDAFRRRGYHNTSMVDIAANLNLTKAALYYYVKSKEEILFEYHLMVYDSMDRILIDQARPDLAGLGELSHIFSELVKMLTRDGVSLLTDVSSLGGEWATEVLMRRNVIESKITNIVERGMDDGSIRQIDSSITVYFFMGALNWLNAWYRADGRMDGEQIAQHFTEQMRQGIMTMS